MDWSEHFGGDDGSTPFKIVTHPPPRNPTFESNLPYFLEKIPTYNCYTAYALCVNYVLGCGVLGIPYAVGHFGLWGGVAALAIVTLVSFCTVMCVFEVGEVVHEREASITRSAVKSVYDVLYGSVDKMSVNNKSITNTQHSGEENSGEEDSRHLLLKQSPGFGPMDAKGSPPDIANPPHHYEVNELVEILLGKRHQRMYNGCLLGLMYVGLLAYSQVFNNSITTTMFSSSSESVTIHENSFDDHFVPGDSKMQKFVKVFFPPMLFSAVTLPLSCVDLESQTNVQIFMFLMRFVSIFSMN